MIDKESADYFYEQVKLILTSEINDKTINNLEKLYKEAIDLILQNTEIDFSSYLSKLNYIIQTFSVPDELGGDFIKLKSYLKFNKNIIVQKQNLDKSVNIFITFIQFFSNTPLPHSYNFEELPLDLPIVKEESRSKKERADFYDAIVVNKKNNDLIICKVDDLKIIVKIDLNFWKTTYDILWKYCSINLINLERLSKDKNIYKADMHSGIVIEPNYLIDVTDLSSCFNQNQPLPILYFTKKFNTVFANTAIIIGNFVNNIFDELLSDKNQNLDNIIEKSIRQKYLQVFSLVLNDKTAIKNIKEQIKVHIENLKTAIEKIESDSISIEPTFISPKYGLQGRLDALITFRNDKYRKNIIELKSGNFPTHITPFSFEDEKKIFLNIWYNHLIQANCYDLLINSTFPKRTGTTSILYSKDNEKPIRDATLTPFETIIILNTRNQIIYLDKLLRAKEFNLFYKYLKKSIYSANNFIEDELNKILDNFQNADKLTNHYFFEYLALVQKEIYISKIGNSSTKGFSSLWLDTYTEKIDNFTALTNLELDYSGSDFDNFHLVFTSKSDLSNFNSLRKGDQAILYPINNSEAEIYKNQLLKCIIKEIDSNKIKISLRNKSPDYLFLLENKNWIIEQDLSDSLLSKIIASVYQVYNLSDEKKAIIFGKKKPEFEEINTKIYSGLNEAQNIAINKALAAKNYFLIQGPPGTGKTSYVIKTIISEVYTKSNNDILVLAYTNRAVDEIISAIKTIKENIQLIRFGSKESSEHHDILLSNLSEKMDLNELYKKLKQTRIFAATVASVLYNPEILKIVKFDLAIIDEASQILEPYLIKIVSEVKKFILIGDEKQLPAIIRLNEKDTEVNNQELQSIGITNFRLSFFERLLNLCKKNNWTDAFTLLNLQARMHSEIQEFPNKYFYNSKLKVMSENQNKSASKYYENCQNNFLSKILCHRIVFINSKQEIFSKINLSEVNFIKKFVTNLFKDYTSIKDNTLGIISPFRAQCAEILKNFDHTQKKFVACDTVERFQGSERDIIIISLATNFEYLTHSIQSLIEIDGQIIDRKLNVAMTRAKDHLIILGNSDILQKAPVYDQLINFLHKKNKIFDLKDFNE